MKTEKEKMLAGEGYFASDPELCEGRRHAKRLLFRLSQLPPDAKADRAAVFEELFGTWRPNASVVSPFYCDYGYNIHVGEEFYANTDCVFLDVCEIRIGDRVLLGPRVQLITAKHPIDPKLRATGIESGAPIVIEDDVWLGAGVIVCPGVRIGRGAVIGAGAVVTRDVPAGTVSAGNPCRVIRPIGE